MKALEKNIRVVIRQVSYLVIVDNGSTNFKKIQHSLFKIKQTKLISLKSNRGISYAQNKGFRYFKSIGFKWVLTLDQDSLIPSNSVDKMVSSNPFKNQDTGIIGMNFLSKGQKISSGLGLSEPYEVDTIISSGNLVSVEAWDNVGGFDDFLFIDSVDFDFNIRLKLMGYKIWKIENLYMEHTIGMPIKQGIIKKMFLFKNEDLLFDHPPFRIYYIERNNIILSKRYTCYKRHFFQSLVSILWLRRVIFFKKDRVKKILAGLHGVIDGMKYNPKDDIFFNKFKVKLIGKKN